MSYNSKHGTYLLDLVHCDLQGPIHRQSLSRAKHFIIIVDDAGGLSLLRMLEAISDSVNVLKNLIQQMVATTSRCVNCFRGDSAP